MRTKIVVAGFAVTALALTACSGGSGGGGTAPEAAPESGPVTLSYGLWDQNQVPAMQKIADEFHTANPNVTVKIQVTPFRQYFTSLQTAATGGSAPDVFWMNGPNIKLYASNGILLPLDQAIKAGNLTWATTPRP